MVADLMKIRRAGRRDEEALLAMQAQSFRALGQPFYAADAIESYIRHAGTMDPAILDEGHYFVGEVGSGIAACGGWSTKRPQYAVFEDEPGKTGAGPVVRSIFVDPRYARLGLGRAIMRKVEADLVSSGYLGVSLTATLSGVQFYRRLGYRVDDYVTLKLPDGRIFEGFSMQKQLELTAGGRLAA